MVKNYVKMDVAPVSFPLVMTIILMILVTGMIKIFLVNTKLIGQITLMHIV